MSLRVLIFLALGFIFLLNFQGPVLAENKKQRKFKFCIVDSKHTHKPVQDFCQNLVKLDKVECIIKTDRISCLKLLLNKEADFTTAEPEDLTLLGLSKYNSEILVTHELRVWEKDETNFKMVMVVRKNIERLYHLKNKHLCLPGFGKDSDYVQCLENKVIGSNCDPMKGILENRLSDLSSYFESACISGSWSGDSQFDTEMKSKYDNLCHNCKNHLSCSNDDEYHGKEGVLLCLTEGGGDVAWARLEFVQRYFERSKEEAMYYRFLCPDGTTRNLQTDDPCIWLSEPVRTIIAGNKVAGRIKKFLIDHENRRDSFEMLPQYDFPRTAVNIESMKTPADYLKFYFPDYYSLFERTPCKTSKSIKWCVVTNLEAEKCKWISYAAKSYRLEPFIECVQETSRKDCIISVKDGRSEIFAVKSHEESEARKIGLKPIIQMVTNDEKIGGNETVALVKKTTDLYTFEQLEYRKACFSGYRDAGWNAFIYYMRNLTGDDDWYCKDMEKVSYFFRDSCVLDLEGSDSRVPENLYSLCSHSELNNIDKITLNCLNSAGAIVAFLHYNPILKFYPNNFDEYYRTLCVNGSRADEDREDKCFLSWTTLGSIMSSQTVSPTRETDIYFVLMNLERLFGETFQGPTPMVSLFGTFEGETGVIFPEFTESLQKDVSNRRPTVSYHEILEDITKRRQLCNKPKNSLAGKVEFSIFVPFMFLLRIIF